MTNENNIPRPMRYITKEEVYSDVYIKKERSQKKKKRPNFTLQGTRKERNKSKVNRKNEINIRAEINGIENKRYRSKSVKLRFHVLKR